MEMFHLSHHSRRFQGVFTLLPACLNTEDVGQKLLTLLTGVLVGGLDLWR